MEHHHSDEMFGLRTASSGAAAISPCRLGKVEVTSDDVLALFNLYVIYQLPKAPNLPVSTSFIKHQYYHLPILNTRTPISIMQKNTPLLFWTIIAISCRYHHDYCHLLPPLKDPYHELLGKALTTSPMSLCTIQALLYLCYWPFPCRKQPQDPSWNYCGTAINAAICQGLDSPKDYRWRKLSTEEKNIRLKTWLACFYIGTL
jgi:hypothetical protein